jgi:hypothetical protein
MLLPTMANRCPAAADSAPPFGNFVELAVDLDAAAARMGRKPGVGNGDV